MANSISVTSNTTNSTLATFKVGDAVLCPSLSLHPFVLSNDPRSKRDLLALTHDGSYFYYDDKGYFVLSCDNATGDYQPSLFQDTKANRQTIATLYSDQTSQRTVIDTAEADDKEVIVISSHDLSDIACDIEGAANALNDIGQLLWLIYCNRIEANTAVSMARLTHDATSMWADLLYRQLDAIKEPLAMTTYGKEGKQ